VSAQPVEQFDDPRDPENILHALPERERDEFLRQYQAAVDAAHEPAGFRKLQEMLHAWSLVVAASSKPGYYETLEAVQNGTADTVPIQELVPDWDERVAAARSHR
jgi:hypothetical protein